MHNPRETLLSVTIFLFCGDEYLFQLRSPKAKINAGELNGLGGKLEPSEDYVAAAIRETEEESGYKIQPSDIQFCGIIKFEGGYAADWITCFFKVEVPHQNIPIGTQTREGELLWIQKDKVLNSEHKLVDDLYYCFEDIVSGRNLFFMTVEIGGQDLRIIKERTHKLMRYEADKQGVPSSLMLHSSSNDRIRKKSVENRQTERDARDSKSMSASR